MTVSTGRHYPDDVVSWWQLPTPTADGRLVLDCLHADNMHRAVTVAADALVLCTACRLRVSRYGWSDLDRSLVLCGRCHDLDHAGGVVIVPATPAHPPVPGQLDLLTAEEA